jgi:hypothetical protein
MKFMKLGRLTLITTLALGCLAGGTSTASAQQGDIVVRFAPPAPRAEVRGSYRAGYDWVPGYWRWDGRRHVWIAGHWERARAGYVWQPPRWDQRSHGWVFIPGRWVRGGRRHQPPPAYDPPRHDRPHDRPGYRRPGHGRNYWQRQGWKLLGEESVSGRGRGRRVDRDTIHIGHDRGRFYRIMVVVDDSDVELHGMLVTFGNGTTWSPRVRHRFRENSRSRAIDLPKGGRFLRSVSFRYSNLPGGGRAVVQLWGK